MRLGILTQYYPPEVGAPQARLSDLVRRFAERGHEVFILTAMPNYPRGHIYPGYGGLFRREERDGISITRAFIYPTKKVSMIPRLTNYLSFVFSSLVVGGMTLPKVDYLITESPPLFLGISGYLLSRCKHARWIFNVSDLWPETAVRLGLVEEGWSLQMAYALEAFCYNKAWLVTGQTRGILENIQHRFPRVSTYHLSNGVDTHLFCPGRRSPRARRELAGDKDCIAIYAGLHGVAQGLEQILEAATRLQDLDHFCIVFVGDGPEKERLVNQRRALGLTNVQFLDPYPREAMPALLASADIALVPLKKGFPDAAPSKLYEAMGVGLPVVIANGSEGANIVRKAQAGVAVPPEDAETLAMALRDLVKNPDKRSQLGACGRQAAVAHFDRQAIAEAFINLLENRL